jgi:mycothiol S-conjugate amidase
MAAALRLLTIHAHPDDEASKGAPTVAKYVAEGVQAVLVCCTGGEEGDIQNKSLLAEGGAFFGLDEAATKAKLVEVREQELARSVEILGFSECIMLGYRDSGMKDSPANENPQCFWQADLDEATGRLVGIIRRLRPQVLLTYNDDQQGYPHPDHLRVHDVSVLAWERAGDSAWYPDMGQPWTPSKMYFTLWSKDRSLKIHHALIAKHGKSPFKDDWFERPNQDERITTRVPIADYMWARTESLRAHATQVDPDEAWWFGLSDEELVQIHPWEDWVLAASRVGYPEVGEIETDLFAGVREMARS